MFGLICFCYFNCVCLLSKTFGPLFGNAIVLVAIAQVLVSDGADERIVRVAVGEQRTYGEQHFADGERRTPVVLEYVETDGALRVHVAVVDARLEGDLGRLERIVAAEVNVQVEDAVLVDAARRAQYG